MQTHIFYALYIYSLNVRIHRNLFIKALPSLHCNDI